MKFISFCIVAALFSLSIPISLAQTSSESAFVLYDGTPVRLQLSREMSSGTATTGETIDFEVMEDVVVEGFVIIPKGSVALGSVIRAKRKGRMGRGGKLDISIDSVRLPNGEKVPLRSVREAQGNNKTGTMTGAMVVTGVLFFPAAPLFLLMKGKDIKIPKGAEATAYTNGDFPLDKNKYDQKADSEVVTNEN